MSGQFQSLEDAVEALIPDIEAAAEEAERERKPADHVMRALEETGLFKSFVPQRFGGMEIDYATFMRIGIRIAEACASTGWVTTFCMEHNWLLAHFDPAAQQQVWDNQPYFLAPGSISPNGRAEAVEGGHQLNGRWQWGTGVMHADWALLAGMLPPAGDGPPEVRMFMVPIGDVTVEDTWHVDGMAATGSNDMIVEDLFVPAHMSQSVAIMAQGHSSGSLWLDSPTFKTPMIPFKCITAAAPAVGSAKRAVALFRERVTQRTQWGSQTKQQDSASAQMRLGNLMVRAQQAEVLMLSIATQLEAWGTAAQPCPGEERARIRLSCAHVVHLCRDIVRDVMEASGASAHFLSNPLQRIHRDVHTMACHTVFDKDLGSEAYGQLLLGLTPARPI